MLLSDLIIRLSADIGDLDRKMKMATRHVESAAAAMTSAGFAISAGISMPLYQVGKAALQTAGDMEAATTAFATMAKSTEVAKKHMEDLKKFTLETPFILPQLIQASRLMQAYGASINEVIPRLKIIGNAVAALGGIMGGQAVSATGGGMDLLERVVRSLGEISTRGRITGEQLRELSRAGIPALQAVADKLGVTTAEAQSMIEKGAVGSKKALDAVLEYMEQKYGGGMAALMQTFPGMMSNIKDNIIFTLAEIGNALLPAAKSIITNFVAPTLSAIRSISTEFKNLPQAAQIAIGGVVLIPAAIGSSLLPLGAMIWTLSQVAKATIFLGPHLLTAFLGGAAAVRTLGQALGMIPVAAGAASVSLTSLFTGAGRFVTVGWMAAIAGGIRAIEGLVEMFGIYKDIKKTQDDIAASDRDRAAAIVRITTALKALKDPKIDAQLKFLTDKSFYENMRGVDPETITREYLLGLLKIQIAASKTSDVFKGLSKDLSEALSSMGIKSRESLLKDIKVLEEALKGMLAAPKGTTLPGQIEDIRERLKKAKEAAYGVHKTLKDAFSDLGVKDLDVEVTKAVAAFELISKGFVAGTVTTHNFALSLKAVKEAMEAAADTSGLADAFKRSGVKPQSELDSMAAQAMEDYRLINEAILTNGKTQGDATRMWVKYMELDIEALGSMEAANAKYGEASIESFLKVREAMRSPLDQLKTLKDAFSDLRAKYTDLADVEKVNLAFEKISKAFLSGKVSLVDFSAAWEAMKVAMGEWSGDDLAGVFKEMGVKSQSELNNLASKARAAYQRINEAILSGGATQRDANDMWVKYISADIEALGSVEAATVKYGDATIDSFLRLQDSAKGTANSLISLDAAFSNLRMKGSDVDIEKLNLSFERISRGFVAGTVTAERFAGAYRNLRKAIDEASADEGIAGIFTRAGVKSQAELRNLATTAEAEYRQINEAILDNQATQMDASRMWVRYIEAMIESGQMAGDQIPRSFWRMREAVKSPLGQMNKDLKEWEQELRRVAREAERAISRGLTEFIFGGGANTAALQKTASQAEDAYNKIKEAGEASVTAQPDIIAAYTRLTEAQAKYDKYAATATPNTIRLMKQAVDAAQENYDNLVKAAKDAVPAQEAVIKAYQKMLDAQQKVADPGFWRRLRDTAVGVVKDITKALLELALSGIIKKGLSDLFGWLSGIGGMAPKLKDIFKTLSDIFKTASSSAGAATKTATDAAAKAAADAAAKKAAGVAGIGGGGGAAGATSAAAGWMGIVNVITGAVTAISSVIGNFQMYAMNKSLDLIEKSTRYTEIITAAMYDVIYAHVPLLKWIMDYMWNVQAVYLQKICAGVEAIAAGSGPQYSVAGGGGATFSFTNCTFGSGLSAASVEPIFTSAMNTSRRRMGQRN